MHDFSEAIQGWQTFYATLAASCATLIGLLFIAITFHPDLLTSPGGKHRIRIARKTFGDFFLVLVTSLVFLIPRLSPQGLATALFALGVAWSLRVVAGLVVAGLQERSVALVFRSLIPLSALSLLGGIGLIGVSVAIWLEYTDILYWLVGALAALLASASTAAWSLLTQSQDKVVQNGRRRQRHK